ncbi:MAG TPA: hypothetical protein VEC35_03525 [Noviherbaspirillum sp.]|nr:hypothetical protein [Noviherbaspirillum sp.]
MLGEMIGEDQGKITSVRVLPFNGQSPQTEVSFQSAGNLVGVQTTQVGTYISTLMPTGVFNGTGQGIVMTQDGDTAIWTGSGVGTPKGKGLAASWRGSIFFQTTAQRLSGLNKFATMFEFEVDENGNTTGKFWEWK